MTKSTLVDIKINNSKEWWLATETFSNTDFMRNEIKKYLMKFTFEYLVENADFLIHQKVNQMDAKGVLITK